ncbi:MAG: hypothetical protein ACJ76Y_32530 [Thermoanaerobaculia bacterium]
MNLERYGVTNPVGRAVLATRVWVDDEGSEIDLIGYAERYEAACDWGREIAWAHRVELDIEALPA